jgi:predicted esterase
MPAMTDGQPAAGKFVKQVAPEYKDTQVYHALYLPTDWVEGKSYPVIVEYAGNYYPPICTGKVDDCKLGYYQSGGKGFIWVVLPYVSDDKKKNQPSWWGDLGATVAYCKTNVPRICRQYGGDTSSIFLTGFSRGAIACGYIGLHDDEIADLWLGFLPHSHHDGGSYSADGARERLARINGRASFLTWGGNDGGRENSQTGKGLLEVLKFPVTGLEIPRIGHTDLWIVEDSPTRQALRKWLQETIRAKPGTHAVGGKVVDGFGNGISGVSIQSGIGHWTQTDEQGRYTLRGLVDGKRTLTATKSGMTFAPAQAQATLAGKDLADVTFTGAASRPAE